LKKIICSVLVIVMMVGMCPAVFADTVSTYSDELVEFIASKEGFAQYQYEDAGRHWIGFGNEIEDNQYPDGITKEQAYELMKNHIDEKIVPVLNQYLVSNNISVNQYQYDALVSLTYNVGESWMNGYRISNYLKNGISKYTDVQIADALGCISHQGSSVLVGLINRRLAEAKVFLYGDYSGNSSKEFCWIITDVKDVENGNDVFIFEKGKQYGYLPTARTEEGMYFLGWKNDSTGAMMSLTDMVTGNVRASAVWSDQYEEQVSTDIVLPYTDVDGNAWYYPAVRLCYVNGLMGGTSDTTFAPNLNMTRAMLVTVLWRMEGSPVVSTEMKFTDVPEGQWYTNAIRWASATGIVNGTSETTFEPNSNITREQLVKVIYSYYLQVTGTQPEDYQGAMGMAGYEDAGSISSWAYSAFYWAKLNGIVQGSDGKLNPQGLATRAQVAQILYNFMSMVAD